MDRIVRAIAGGSIGLALGAGSAHVLRLLGVPDFECGVAFGGLAVFVLLALTLIDGPKKSLAKRPDEARKELSAQDEPKTTEPTEPAGAIKVSMSREDGPQFSREYTVKLDDGATLEVTWKTYLGSRRASGTLRQPNWKWVSFEPERPADRILDPRLLPLIEANVAEIRRLDREFMAEAASEFTDERGRRWVLAEAQNGWRPMQTAPKDGTTVLLAVHEHTPRVVVRQYYPDVDPAYAWDDDLHSSSFDGWMPLPPPAPHRHWDGVAARNPRP